VVISVHMLGPSADPAGYYLAERAGCPTADPTGYYLADGPSGGPAGRWVGAGAAAAGLFGPIDAAGADVLRGLLAGRAPDGSHTAARVLRADPRGRLPAGRLLDAIRAVAVERGVPPAVLFAEPADRAMFEYWTRQAERPGGKSRAATVEPVRAGRLAAAVGLDPHAVFRTVDRDGTRSDRYADALKHAGRKVDTRRPGIDLTVSAPKSVSVLFGLGDRDVVDAVRAAHEAAIGQALAYMEQAAGHGLRGHQGDGQRASRIRTDGWIAASFEHHTSRAADPQLHTHLVLANLLHGADGKWSALDSRAVHRHKQTGSYVYHAALRAELTRTLGVQWTPVDKGIAEIAGVPRPLRRLFSTRRAQIDEHLAKTGRTGAGPAAAEAACLATRPAKKRDVPERTLRERWTATATAAGHAPDRLLEAVLGRARPPALPELDVLTQQLLGPAGLTAQATGFDRRDLLQAICQTLPPGAPVSHRWLQATADQVLAHRDVIRLISDPEAGARWTTRELLQIEAAGLNIADQLRAQNPDPAAPDDPRLAGQRPPTGEQRPPDAELRPPLPGNAPPLAAAPGAIAADQQALAHALANTHGLAVVVGPAGSGKTAALAAAHRAWQAQGRPVLGAAVAAVTARRLERATGISSTSIAALAGRASRRDRATGQVVGLPVGGVLVVDEASMADTRTLTWLLHRTQKAGATLVLVGDPAQLPEVGAGGLFTALARHPQTHRLIGNQRQTQAWEQRALADLRAGDPTSAIAAYAEHGRIHPAPAEQLPDRIVDDYLRHVDAAASAQTGDPGERVVMLAVRRDDVAELNATTRDRLLEQGRLGPDALTTDATGQGDGEREYRAGDRVLVTANDHHVGVLNGARARVTAVDPETRRMRLTTDDRQDLTVGADWAAEHLDHGYAMTCHKAQGATVEVALVYGSSALTREAGYVALSRGRTANHLYITDTSDQPQRTDADRSPWLDPVDLDRLATQLTTSRAQMLATEQLPKTPAPASSWRRHEQHRTTQPAPDRYGGISR
jgi:conjugative relaxase-like TrwC/TraI family protein